MGDGPFQLHSETLGSLPIIGHFLARTRLEDLLRQRLDAGSPARPGHAACLGVLLRNILLAREPLYALGEWCVPFRSDLLGIPSGPAGHLTDDKIGRALDRLFDTDRASLQTEIVVRVIREFRIDLSRLHSDTTTVSFAGNYKEATGEKVRGKETVAITFGHPKNHRPDLKQLLWNLAVSADGAVPIHYKVYDGNTSDVPTHRETWDALRALVDRPDFLYVGDSKLCAEGTMQHIDGNGGQFLTVLPRTRKEDSLFREWMQTHDPVWTEVAREEGEGAREADVRRMTESPVPAADGFRLVWVWSSRMAAEDRDAREDIMRRAYLRLERLETRLRSPKCKYRDRAGVAAAAEKTIGERAERWVDYEIREEEEARFKQEKRGRPGKGTKYQRLTKTRFHVSWKPKAEAIRYDARTDGMFPLLTNRREMGLGDLLEAYRFQPRLEKRHEQLKTVYGVAPVLLKKVTRIEGLLFVYFLVLLVEALIEREVRRGMAARELKGLPIYPEGRWCEAPTTDRVFELFTGVQMHRLRDGEKEVQVFRPELTTTHREVLSLMGVPVEAYEKLA